MKTELFVNVVDFIFVVVVQVVNWSKTRKQLFVDVVGFLFFCHTTHTYKHKTTYALNMYSCVLVFHNKIIFLFVQEN